MHEHLLAVETKLSQAIELAEVMETFIKTKYPDFDVEESLKELKTWEEQEKKRKAEQKKKRELIQQKEEAERRLQRKLLADREKREALAKERAAKERARKEGARPEPMMSQLPEVTDGKPKPVDLSRDIELSKEPSPDVVIIEEDTPNSDVIILDD